MRILYYLKWPLIILVAGYLIRTAGALFKIRHWPFADGLLTSGTVVMAPGLIFLIVKLIINKPRSTT